jgi:non-canonical (house-cleaning) NTP pyrophosphatase
MKFFVASTNPVKINAVKQVVSKKFPQALVKSLEVASGVAAQPMRTKKPGKEPLIELEQSKNWLGKKS